MDDSQARDQALLSKLSFLGEKFRISSKEGSLPSGAISDSNICCSKVSTVLYSGRKEKGHMERDCRGRIQPLRAGLSRRRTLEAIPQSSQPPRRLCRPRRRSSSMQARGPPLGWRAHPTPPCVYALLCLIARDGVPAKAPARIQTALRSLSVAV